MLILERFPCHTGINSVVCENFRRGGKEKLPESLYFRESKFIR